MIANSQKAGAVNAVRELKDGVQATVTIGFSIKHGYTRVQVVSDSPAVREALDALKEVLREEAHQAILLAQESERSRGHRPIGAAE